MSQRLLRSAGNTGHPAHPTNEWVQESLFARLSRQAMFRPAAISEVVRTMRLAWGIRNPLLSYAVTSSPQQLLAMQSLMSLLRCEEVSDLRRITGADLVPREEQYAPQGMQKHRVLATSLRYCRECMALGFHTMLFQHWAVSRCPLHASPLLDACWKCGESVAPTIRRVIALPYCCERCDQLWLKTVPPDDALEQLRRVGKIVMDWRRDLAVPSEARQSRVLTDGLGFPACAHPRDAPFVRLMHRATAWPTFQSYRWQRFREAHCAIDEPFTPDQRKDGRPEAMDVGPKPTQVLNWLVSVCQAPREHSAELVSNSWIRIQVITPIFHDIALSAKAVALHLTITKYGQQWRAPSGERHFPSGFEPYTGTIWNGLHAPTVPRSYGAASGELIAYEILGFFALTLLLCAGLKPMNGHESSSSTAFEDRSFCPTWRVSHEGRSEWIMRSRPRATAALVLRLLKRYEHRKLRTLVTCSAPQGHAVPHIADLSPAPPRELLHFPAGSACKP